MTTEPREVFSIRLKELREKARLTQSQLAESIGSDNVQISRYETGAITPSIETLVKLANVFDCSTDYLLGLSDSRGPNVWISGEFSPDERRVIQAVRERDVPTALVVLSVLFSAPRLFGVLGDPAQSTPANSVRMMPMLAFETRPRGRRENRFEKERREEKEKAAREAENTQVIDDDLDSRSSE